VLGLSVTCALGSGSHGAGGKSDGISGKFDYVKLLNWAGNLPKCPLDGIHPSPGCQFRCKSWVMNPNGTAIPRPDWRCRCFYGITSEGLTETRIRLQFGRAHRGVLAKRGTLAKNAREELRTE
jgi:hypothetical protein